MQIDKANEARHFDDAVSGKDSEFVFYNSDFLSHLMADITAFAYAELGNLTGKTVLIYGSGVNLKSATDFMNAGATVWMVDISPKSVENLNQQIEKKKYANIFARVMDCESLDYPEESFDLIYGRAILHHLDLHKCLAEIHRVLKKDGKAVFLEPLGMNPFINFYRFLTPSRRTPEEHPFKKSDIVLMEAFGFSGFSHTEFNFVTNLGILLETIMKMKVDSYSFFKKIDDFVLGRLKFLRPLCWNTVLSLKK